jgi:hypothetical protein
MRMFFLSRMERVPRVSFLFPKSMDSFREGLTDARRLHMCPFRARWLRRDRKKKKEDVTSASLHTRAHVSMFFSPNGARTYRAFPPAPRT